MQQLSLIPPHVTYWCWEKALEKRLEKRVDLGKDIDTHELIRNTHVQYICLEHALYASLLIGAAFME